MYIYECHGIRRMTGKLLWQQLNIVLSQRNFLCTFFFKDLKSVSVVATWVDGTYMTGYIIFLCLACWMFLSCFVSGTSIVNPFLSIQTFWRKKKVFNVRMCEGMNVLWLHYS